MPKPASYRRKQNLVYHEEPELEQGQCVARVLQAYGENTYEVETEDGAQKLYSLPKRLRYISYIGHGTFVFVRNDGTRRQSKINGDIEAVVLDHFLSNQRKKPYWPARFAQEKQLHPSGSTVLTNKAADTASKETDYRNKKSDKLWTDGEGEGVGEGEGSNENKDQDREQHSDESDEDDQWFVGMGNPNRSAPVTYDDSDEESE